MLQFIMKHELLFFSAVGLVVSVVGLLWYNLYSTYTIRLRLACFDFIPEEYWDLAVSFWHPSYVGILLYIAGNSLLRQPLREKHVYKRWPRFWKVCMIVSNLAFSIFSLICFLALFHAVFSRQNPFDGREWESERLVLVQEAFYWSKYVEFIDTFFLLLLDKKVSWLHYLHHLGAPLAWGIGLKYQVRGTWLPTLLNAFVHTWMYLYFAFMVLKWRFLLPKTLITSMQIAQLVSASALWVYLYGARQETNTISKLGGFFGVAYGLMCAAFFFNFFYVNYVKKISSAKKKGL